MNFTWKKKLKDLLSTIIEIDNKVTIINYNQ